jgi:hypothetical protein
MENSCVSLDMLGLQVSLKSKFRHLHVINLCFRVGIGQNAQMA